MVPPSNHYEIQGARNGLNERARELFWRVLEDANKDVPKDARKADLKRPGPLLDGLRRYVRNEVGFEDASVADALAYFCSAAKAEGLTVEAYTVAIYGKAYLRKMFGGSGGSSGGVVRSRGTGARTSRRHRGDEER